MDETRRVELAARLARVERELQAAERARDGSPEGRTRYAAAKAAHAEAEAEAREVLRALSRPTPRGSRQERADARACCGGRRAARAGAPGAARVARG
jgi:hypothetical protein